MRCSSADVRKGQNCVLHANAIAAIHSTHQLVLQLKCRRRRLAHARQKRQQAWTGRLECFDPTPRAYGALGAVCEEAGFADIILRDFTEGVLHIGSALPPAVSSSNRRCSEPFQ